MTDFTADTLKNRGSFVTRAINALGHGLVWLAETSSKRREVEALNATSDEELARRGTTRANEVRRIFASCGAI